MRIPLIKIRDKHTGDIRILGEDTHDLLYVDGSGKLSYYNLQNGDGTGEDDDCGYEFVVEEDRYMNSVALVGLDEWKKETKYDDTKKWSNYLAQRMRENEICSTSFPHASSKEEADNIIKFYLSLMNFKREKK